MADEPGGTILTIDDEPVVRQTIRSYLQGYGYDVLEAADGRAGLEVFERSHADLVLADLKMPGVDGLGVLAAIAERSPQTPVIVVSGAGAIGDAIGALQLGAWDYVLKPIEDLAVLRHAVTKALERARLRRENVARQRDLEDTLGRIREDEEAGRKVQMKLLPPRTSTIGPYSLRRHVLPSTYLSGDFVDYFSVHDQCLAFCSADVSGHGVSSALVTVLLKSFMRKQLDNYERQGNQTILRPAAMLHSLNAELLGEDLGKHVTMFFGLLSHPQNTLTFANGGQFPDPILWTRDGVEDIQADGAAVGLFPAARYQETELKLPPDFRLAVFSDGVLDALPQEGLPLKLDALRTLRTDAAIDDLVRHLESRPELPDDATVLTISKGCVYERE